MKWTLSDELNALLDDVSDLVLRDRLVAFMEKEGESARNEGYDEGYDDGHDDGYFEGEMCRDRD